MRKKSRNRHHSGFSTLLAVLVTLLIVGIVGVVVYGWHALGFSSYSVSYSSPDTDIIGAFPDKRNFDAGDEVVVRAGSISKKDSEFLGWKDVHGVIEGIGEVLENGAVFTMPEHDVLLEAVWEEEDKASDKKSDNKKSGSDDKGDIYVKKPEKDYINVRSTYTYDCELVAKITDGDTQIKHTGKIEEVYDEDDLKTYSWYEVTIPSLDKEGWIRSDMLTKYTGSAKSDSEDSDSEESENSDSEETKEVIYVKSSSYNSIRMYEEPDIDSEVIEKVTDDELALYFRDDTKKTTDDEGETTTWYFVEDSETGNTGWIQGDRLQKVEE